MNFKFRLTTFQKWSIVVKIALNEVCRDGLDLVLACLILYPMEEAIESTKNERVFTFTYTFSVSRVKASRARAYFLVCATQFLR